MNETVDAAAPSKTGLSDALETAELKADSGFSRGDFLPTGVNDRRGYVGFDLEIPGGASCRKRERRLRIVGEAVTGGWVSVRISDIPGDICGQLWGDKGIRNVRFDGP